jgi:hypothetical protein
LTLSLPNGATAPAPTSDPTQRPDSGLARGRWEAPPWAFWLVFAAAVLGGVAWIALALRSRMNFSGEGPRKTNLARGPR